MKILFCTWQYAPEAAGGAENQAKLQADELVRRGHEVTVVCPRSPGLRSEFVVGVRVVRLRHLRRRPLRRITYLFSLAAFLVLRVRSFDVVHVHIANLQADVAVAVCRLMGTPTHVKLASGGAAGELGRFKAVARLTRWYGLRHASSVQAISTEIAEDLVVAGIESDRIVRIPNGIDASAGSGKMTSEQLLSVRAGLGISRDDVMILFVGRFAAYKGMGELLEAWSSLHDEWPTAHLVLLGRPATDSPVGEIVSGDRFSVIPWTDDVSSYLRAADIFVLPSHSEGMSNALLEAMRAGIAIVATDVGAAREMLDNGEAGCLVPARSSASLVDAIAGLIANERQRGVLGTRARQKVGDFAITEVVAALETRYMQLCRGNLR